MDLNTARPATPLDIRAAWQELKSALDLRNSDAAQALGISEAELIASAIGQGVKRLDGDFRDILKRVPELGAVMALTRNESCVHEKDGEYEHVSTDAMAGLVQGGGIDLRLYFLHWSLAYAVEEQTPRGTQRSLQFFDACGTAVHKIYLRGTSSLAAYTRLTHGYASANQLPIEAVLPPPGRAVLRPDHAIDIAGMRDAWAALNDTHAFITLLKKFGVARTQALDLAGPEYARRVSVDAVRAVLEAAAADERAVTVFAGNHGCLQIHSGPVSNIRADGCWLKVLDPGFSLQLRMDRVAESWVVTKPTADGPVTSLELFDAEGESIAMLFGAGMPGEPEQCQWRGLLDGLFPRAK